ncbi:hypothetical protein TNCV_1356391 [Trichonephila clavipes]|uniref:Uncharacterized protein n=1 Tax=Trichonephila clavipes TaxID=2585209 RepID=A0A8X6VHQ6_TRICX|nr:hypothetical protein TNCV_1356391 [Trichonephila clavipes]
MGQSFQVDYKKSQCFKIFSLIHSFDDDEASVSLGHVTQFTPDAERQLFQGHGSRQVVFPVDPFVYVMFGPAIFGGHEEVRVVHREANQFWIFAILWNAGDRQYDGDRLATMVRHVGMGKKG